MEPLHHKSDQSPPDATVIVVNYNTASLLPRMFDAVEAARGHLSLQIIVVDNASVDGSVELLRKNYPGVDLIENKMNVGFGRANNQAVERARGRYVLLLNTDAFVAPDTLQKTMQYMDSNPGCGVLGVKLVGPDGAPQPSCRYFPTPWNLFAATGRVGMWFHRTLTPRARLVDDSNWNPEVLAECDWVPGCYYLVRRAVVEKLGLFDPRFFMYYEEVDHCRRVRAAGWSVVYFPDTQVVHIGGVSAAAVGPLTVGRQISALMIESELLYIRKYYGLAGIFGVVAFGALGNAISACGGLLHHLDTKRVLVVARQTWTQLRLLAATRFATQPTR